MSSLYKRISLIFLLILALLLSACDSQPPVVQSDRYLVGTYYYLWYPRNFSQGWLRAKLVPPQEPVLGLYSSRDPRVAEQHIAWCSRYGVDFLALSWWPSAPEQNKASYEGLLKARNLGDIKFCIFYETQNLGFDQVLGITLMTREKIDRFIADVRQVAKTFFNHPSYLKVADRPVIFFYLTRSVYVNYVEAFTRLREALKKDGFDPYIIGDEIFWKVIEAKGSWDESKPKPKPTDSKEPQVERAKLFDAITAYNMYEGGKTHHAGYGADSGHVAEVAAKYKLYRDALKGKVAFVPDILPGYNDRGVRLNVNHYAIPRQWAPEDPQGSFFSQSFQRLAFPFVDPTLNMIMITSFNEWNEDTSIEPLKPAPPTNRDQSGSGRDYTQGYSYVGYGTTYLEVVRDQVIAVAGRATKPDGTPAARAKIKAWRDGKEAGSDLCDSSGFYTLSRLGMPPGEYEVGLASGGPRRKVMVVSERTILDVNFSLDR
jgi:glycoprotein endo-alpha-1,2-mannosidase